MSFHTTLINSKGMFIMYKLYYSAFYISRALSKSVG